jgi:hypothetical protein
MHGHVMGLIYFASRDKNKNSNESLLSYEKNALATRQELSESEILKTVEIKLPR